MDSKPFKFQRHSWRGWRVFHFNLPGCQATMAAIVGVRQWAPLAAMLIILVWYLFAPSGVSATCVAALAGILGASYLWARSMALNLEGKRALHFTALQVGDELEEILTLTNRSALPALWVEFVDRSHLPGYSVSSVRAADPHNTYEWRAHTTCTQRGVFTLGPWELLTGDPLGIFSVRKVYAHTEEILVYPPLAVLPAALLPHRHNVGDHRLLHQPLPAETINVVTTRPYSPGDPLHHIHWRTYARQGAPFVKTFEPEASSTIWLIPDLDSAVQLGEGQDSTTETAVVLLASLCAQLLQDHLAVGLFAYTDRECVVLPQRSQAHLWPLLRALAPLQPVARRPLADTLGRAHALIKGSDLLVVVTPSLDPDWPRAIRQLGHSRGARRPANAEAILLDPASFSGDPAGQAGQAESFAPFLADLGIPAQVVRRGDIKPMDAAYGELRRWEFITSGTGRVVVRKAPREAGALPLAGHPIKSAGERPEGL
jgi:uncharacterized protein (DUF58 family)